MVNLIKGAFLVLAFLIGATMVSVCSAVILIFIGCFIGKVFGMAVTVVLGMLVGMAFMVIGAKCL